MGSSTKRLIELHLSGNAARHLIDAFVDELPPLTAIRQSMLRELPRHSTIRIDDNVFYVECDRRDTAYRTITIYEQMYPEVDFVLIGPGNADQQRRDT